MQNWLKFISLIAVIVYIALFYLFFPFIGSSYIIFSIIPIILVVFAYHFRLALIIQILFILHRFIALSILHIDFSDIISISQILGTLANISILVLIYYLQTLLKKIKSAELDSKKRQSALEENNEQLKNLNEELITTEEELRQSNEELMVLKDNLEYQNRIISQKEHRLKTIIESQGEGFGITDFKEVFNFVNPAACQIFGVENGELIGRCIKDFISDSEWKKILKETQKRRSSLISTYEIEILNAKNEHRTLLITGSPDYDENGDVTGTIGVFRDITERKLFNDEIVRKNRQFDHLINNIHDIYIKCDFNGRFLHTSPSILKEFNVKTKEEFYKYTAFEWAKISIGEQKRILKKLLKQKQINNYSYSFVPVGGEIQYAELNATLFYDNKNKPKGFEAIIRNTTERIKNEQKLKKKTEIIEQVNRDITSRIEYAKTLQDALLTKKELIDTYLDEYFLLYQAKEIVSGDFYYINKLENYLIITVADSTGHGVSGAFLSILGITYLHEIVRRESIDNPAKALSLLRTRIKATFRTFGTQNTHGFDMALCVIDLKTNKLNYSGAFNPFYLIRGKKLFEYKPTRNPIGNYPIEKEFENTQIQLEHNDCIYLFTDGYQDQFGGTEDKKLGRKKFKELLMRNSMFSMYEQELRMKENLNSWKNTQEQLDDITLLGIRWKTNLN